MKSDSSLPEKRKSRRWLWILLGSPAILVFCIFLVWFVPQKQAQIRLTAYMKYLDETDPNWTPEGLQLARPAVSDRINSANLLMALTERKAKDEDPMPFHLDVSTTQHLHDGIWRQYLDDYLLNWRKEDLEIVRQLKGRFEGNFPSSITKNFFDNRLLHDEKARYGAHLASLEMDRLIEERQFDEAFEMLLIQFHCANSLKHESAFRCLIVECGIRNVTVRTVERWINTGKPTDHQLKLLQEMLNQQRHSNLTKRMLRGVRASLHQYMLSIESGETSKSELWGFVDLMSRVGLSDSESEGSSWRALKRRFLFKPHETHLQLLKMVTEEIEKSDEPWPDKYARYQREVAKPKLTEAQINADPSLALVESLSPLYRQAVKNALWQEAILSSAIVGVAAERFRLQHRRWPGSIEELVSQFLTDVPQNPWNGVPLKIETHSDGIFINSSNPDLHPDRLVESIVFTLFEPKYRRAAPLDLPAHVVIAPDDQIPEVLAMPREYVGPEKAKPQKSEFQITEN
jgi:hypothetical protein